MMRLLTIGHSYVVAANHTSYLDGAVLLAILPWEKSAFVAKSELNHRQRIRSDIALAGNYS